MRGSCLCGAVVFELEAPLELVTHCHCSMCRKVHGADFGTYGVVPVAAYRLREGADAIRRRASSPTNTRAFCSRCGSVVPATDPQGERMVVPVALLDDAAGISPLAHIFVGSKAPWAVLGERLRRFDTLPAGFDLAPVPPREAPEPAAGTLRGSCLCDGVRYRIEGPPKLMRHCHCGRCRKARAAGYATNLFAEAGAVRFSRGEALLESFPVPGALHFTHVFCRTCGSPMPRIAPDRGIAVIPAGGLDDDPGIRPASHIFVADKAPWVEIVDDLPRYDAYETA